MRWFISARETVMRAGIKATLVIFALGVLVGLWLGNFVYAGG